MKKALLLLLLTISTFAVTPNVVLLSSVDTPKIWYHSSEWKIEKTLNKIFKNRFKDSNYNIVIKQQVDQEELAKQLSNPNNIAVYWVSHAASTGGNSGGIGSAGAIVDFHGKDVKDLFKTIHPNIKHLALVGCNARGIVENFKKKGHYKNNPNLKITSFDKKIDARIGLRSSIKQAKGILGNLKKRLLSYPQIENTSSVIKEFYTNRFCENTENAYPITVTRTAKEDTQGVVIKNNNKTLHVFPALKAGEQQVETIYISMPGFSRSNLKLTVDSNLYGVSVRQYLGDFSFETSWDSSWKIFAKGNGMPLGVTKNLFIYKGSTPNESHSESLQPFKCIND